MYWNILPYHTLLYPHHTNLGHTKNNKFLDLPTLLSPKNSSNHPSHSNLFRAETLQLAGKLELATAIGERPYGSYGWVWKPPKTNMLPIFGCYIVAFHQVMFEYWYKYHEPHEPKSKGVVLTYSISEISFKVKCKLGTATPQILGVVIELNHPGHLGHWTQVCFATFRWFFLINLGKSSSPMDPSWVSYSPVTNLSPKPTLGHPEPSSVGVSWRSWSPANLRKHQATQKKNPTKTR